MRKSILALMIGGLALAGSMGAAQAQSRMASRLGEAVLNGERILVHVTVALPPGADANAITEDALRGQGARPLQSAQFKTTGLDWNNFGPVVSSTPAVTQMYIPTGEKVGAYNALAASHATWNEDVPLSRFRFGLTLATEQADLNRCPSLVKECPGPQTFDNKSDVGWVTLSGCCTLGVTWYSTGRPETDMALNKNFTWTSSLNPANGEFNMETVFLHENGHVLGLDHSTVAGAVMEATYAGVRVDLSDDDKRGDIYLYPAANATGTVSGLVTDKNTDAPIAGAVVTIADLPGSTTTNTSGSYELSGIPELGTYTVKVSASGYKSATLEGVTVPTSLANVELEPGTTKGGRRPR